MIRQLFFSFLVVGVTILVATTNIQACPACKNLDGPISSGFNSSIFFLMAMPFTVVALIGGSVFYHYRRASRKPPRNGDAL